MNAKEAHEVSSKVRDARILEARKNIDEEIKLAACEGDQMAVFLVSELLDAKDFTKEDERIALKFQLEDEGFLVEAKSDRGCLFWDVSWKHPKEEE